MFVYLLLNDPVVLNIIFLVFLWLVYNFLNALYAFGQVVYRMDLGQWSSVMCQIFTRYCNFPPLDKIILVLKYFIIFEEFKPFIILSFGTFRRVRAWERGILLVYYIYLLVHILLDFGFLQRFLHGILVLIILVTRTIWRWMGAGTFFDHDFLLRGFNLI